MRFSLFLLLLLRPMHAIRCPQYIFFCRARCRPLRSNNLILSSVYRVGIFSAVAFHENAAHTDGTKKRNLIIKMVWQKLNSFAWCHIVGIVFSVAFACNYCLCYYVVHFFCCAALFTIGIAMKFMCGSCSNDTFPPCVQFAFFRALARASVANGAHCARSSLCSERLFTVIRTTLGVDIYYVISALWALGL